MQNITIHFIFCIFIVRICLHVTFIDIVFVIFLGIVFVTFVDTLSVAFIISSHKLKYQQYFPTILTNTCAKITTAKFLSHAILFTLALPCIVIPFLIWVTCCSIEFAFAITWNMFCQSFSFIYSSYYIEYFNIYVTATRFEPPTTKERSTI